MIKIQNLFSNSFNSIMEFLSSLLKISEPAVELSSDKILLEETEHPEVENENILNESSGDYESEVDNQYHYHCILATDINELSLDYSAYEALLNADLVKVGEIASHSKYWLRHNIENMTDENLEAVTHALEELGIQLEDYTRDDVIEMSFRKNPSNFLEHISLKGITLTDYDRVSVSINDMNLRPFIRDCLRRAGLYSSGNIANRSKYWLLKNIEGLNQECIDEITRELKILSLNLVDITDNELLELRSFEKLDGLIESYLISSDSFLEEKLLEYPKDVLEIDIEDLNLSLRAFNCLKRAGINTVGDIAIHSRLYLSRIKNFGRKSLHEVINKLKELGIELEESDILDEIGSRSKESIKLKMMRDIQNERISESCNEAYQLMQQDKYGEWKDLKKYVLNRTEEMALQKKEVQALRANPPSLQKLDELIGLDAVKEKMKDVIAHTVIAKDKNEIISQDDPDPLNMVFLGNPGTGKTTVAKIVAEIYKDLGIMKSGHLVTVSRSDLVAIYSGQTADKTKEVFNSALDGILFIDEAYSLFYEGQFKNDYGNEVINTLTGLMTENIGRCCVILAGYPKEMEYLLNDSNPGFKGRFPNIINFEDYDAESLEKILKLNLDKRSLKLDSSCHQIPTAHLKQIYANRDRNFSNGRMVVNYLQKVVMNQERRLYKLKLTGAKLTAADYFTLKSEDFNDVLENFIVEKPEIVLKPRFGFVPPSGTYSN